MKISVLTLALGSLLSAGVALAQPPVPYGPPGMYGPRMPGPMRHQLQRPVPAASAAAATVNEGMGKLTDFLQADARPSLEQLKAFLINEVAPYFDFEYMAKAAAGPLWREMQDQQRAALAMQIEQSFLAILTQGLAAYNNQRVEPLADRVSQDGLTATVSVAVIGAEGYPARLDFRLYKGDDGWKTYDVLANGQSAVAHFRREFRQMMYEQHAPRRMGPGTYGPGGYGPGRGPAMGYPRPLPPTSQ